MAAKKSSAPNRAFKVADQIQRDLTELIARGSFNSRAISSVRSRAS